MALAKIYLLFSNISSLCEAFVKLKLVIIPVTCRVKGYTRFVGRYVTGRRKRFRPHKVYKFLIRITSRVDLAMSVCPYERWDLENYKSYNTGIPEIPELLTQRKFVSAMCHAHSNAHKPPKTVAHTVLMLDRKF